ncbi:uncharacterized protein LOC131258185 [Magnolia sinica]|uniref:uncharacterized protein LOC131258185 n=1 Tax=Magnolia sinica TaxID=86752 RepID=UPI00265B2954|nr:uncharacterized protein LOC131258185 [Magnolia sinica]
MPKKSSGWKGKSARKPLSEITNNGTRAKSSNPRNKISSTEEEKTEDGSLDRLLLAHSHLSNLTQQIDELVAQACKLRPTCKIGSHEIESFTHVLSEMHSSLKPWLLRFQQALSSPLESNNQLEQSLETETVSAANEEKCDVTNIPEEPDLGSLISPSPLVSWRGGCRIENGRQLFLLTPLPRSKVLSSRLPGSSRSVLEKVPNMDAPSRTLSLPPLSTTSGISHDDLLEKVEVKSIPEKSKSVVEEPETTMSCRFVSPPKIANHNSRDHSMYLMTPLMKMSPPKTCMLLEPIPEPSQQQNNGIPKLTPLAVRLKKCNNSLTSETSSGQVSDGLGSKYPRLFGIQLSHKPAVRREEMETSLDWFLSPLKTCVLMETPNEKLTTNPVGIDLSSAESELDVEPSHLVCAQDKKVLGGCQPTKQSYNHGLSTATFAAPESTPLWKDIESTVQKGKQPGENTLKRELWTKFESVSTNVLRYDVSLFQEKKSKGFLDRLEEVSCEDTGLESKGLR